MMSEKDRTIMAIKKNQCPSTGERRRGSELLSTGTFSKQSLQ
jgi:hypothetical protein